MKPEFEKYTLSELIEVKEAIDKSRFPERYKEICNLIEVNRNDVNPCNPDKKNNYSISFKDIYEYFKSGIYTRLGFLVVGVLSHYLLAQSDNGDIWQVKLIVAYVVCIVGVFFPMDKSDK
jgi:hypothetical protein